jgi:tagatose-1,6-bisphosphate aldolase
VWGSQYVWQREGARSLAFGRPIWLKAVPPIDFSEFDGKENDAAVLRSVTDSVMDELSRLVEDMRSRYPKQWQ